MVKPLTLAAIAILSAVAVGLALSLRPHEPLIGPGGFEVPEGFTKESESAVEDYVIVTYSGKENLEKAIYLFSRALEQKNWAPVGVASILGYWGNGFERENLVALVSGSITGNRVCISVIVGPKPTQEVPEENIPTQENEQSPEIRSMSFVMFLENQIVERVDVYARNLNTPDIELRIDALNRDGERISYILSWRTQSGWTRFENENWRTFENVGMSFGEFWTYYSTLMNYAWFFSKVYPGQRVSYTIREVTITFDNIRVNPELPDALFHPV